MSHTINFTILGIDFSASDRTQFADDGFVTDITAYRKEIVAQDRKFFPRVIRGIGEYFDPEGIKEMESWRDFIYSKSIGLAIETKRGPIYHRRTQVNIGYLDSQDDLLNMWVRGHEETHALDFLGKRSLLEERLKQEFDIEVDKDLGQEEIADVGGMYALLVNGSSKQEIEFSHKREFPPFYEKGIEVIRRIGKSAQYFGIDVPEPKSRINLFGLR